MELIVTPIGSIPDELSLQIGRIIVAYSYLENTLQMTVRDLTGLGQKEQRLVLREPRAEDRLTLIMDLAEIHGLNVKEPPKFWADLKQATSDRDLLSHALWTVDNGIWRVIRTSGSQDGISRKILPSTEPVSAARLDEIWHRIIALIGTAKDLRGQVAAGLLASPRKPQ